MGLKTKVFEILGNKVEWECNKTGVFLMDKKCFQVFKTSKVNKEHVMVPTWLNGT
jgi:hypothetical protein